MTKKGKSSKPKKETSSNRLSPREWDLATEPLVGLSAKLHGVSRNSNEQPPEQGSVNED